MISNNDQMLTVIWIQESFNGIFATGIGAIVSILQNQLP